MFNRLQDFKDMEGESAFLWGPRQMGKSTLLKKLFPNSPYYDLLQSDEFQRLSASPQLLREELLANPPEAHVIIDEVQKIPALLDEVQWLIVNKGISFILCGSSARKLKRNQANLLGGRALRYELFPLVSQEIPDFSLIKALNHGLISRHYLHKNPKRLIQAYIGDYLKEEILAEALVRNLAQFNRFLEAAAFSSGSLVNYTNIARECGVSANTVKEYFTILSDTLVADFLPAYTKKAKRRLIQASKFYFFDLSLVNFFSKQSEILEGSQAFGDALEQFIFQEIRAHSHYSGLDYPFYYWRSASGLEVDFILGDHEIAIEVKGTKQAQQNHLKGLNAFNQDYQTKRSILVSMDKNARKMGDIEVFPVKDFLEALWNGDLM
jgi:predicted AAA+ superfamily ATPase